MLNFTISDILKHVKISEEIYENELNECTKLVSENWETFKEKMLQKPSIILAVLAIHHMEYIISHLIQTDGCDITANILISFPFSITNIASCKTLDKIINAMIQLDKTLLIWYIWAIAHFAAYKGAVRYITTKLITSLNVYKKEDVDE